jgi:outer membrane receptor protein involved in Fe transport
MQKKILVTAFVFALALSLVAVPAARAQSVLSGKITGTVTDDKGEALPGVSVELAGPSIMGTRAVVTSARGTYVFLEVPPGTFTMTATMPGFKKWVQEGVILSVGKVIEINPVLAIGTIEETVTVVGASPIVDAKTSTVDSRLSKELIAKLPTSRDAFYDLSLTTPGMYDHGSSAGWLPSPTAYSSSSNENVFLVNGVNATNPRGSSFGTLVHVNYNAVEEVRVVALGSKAEYGSFSGAAIDVLTKSGSNEFHGSAAFYIVPENWETTNAPAAGQTYGTDWLSIDPNVLLYSGHPDHNNEANATFGGPILKDRVWFFGAFDYLNNAQPSALWTQATPLLTNSWSSYFDFKLSTEPFHNNRAWIAYHHEGNKYDGGSWGSQPYWDATATYGEKTRNNTVSAQWQWLPLSTTIFTAKYLGFWTNDTPFLPADRPGNPLYFNWWKWCPSFGIEGAFPWIEGWHSNRQTIQADVSHYAENFLGEHDLKFGVQWTRGRSDSLGGYFQNYYNSIYPYRWTQYVGYMQSWYGDEGFLLYLNRVDMPPFMTVGTSDSLAFFLDDQWSLGKRLTINLGLRYDKMTAGYGAGYVYEPLSTPGDIGNPVVARTRESLPDIFDFKTFSPRLGLTYQLTKDAKTVIRASYGRYYLPITVEYLRRLGPDLPDKVNNWGLYEVPFSVADANDDGFIDATEVYDSSRWAAQHINAGTISPIETQTIISNQSYVLNVQGNLKDQYTDQFTVSLEREILKNFSASATFIYKYSRHIFTNVPVLRTTPPNASLGLAAGDFWPYVRVPFTTLDGTNIELYSVEQLDYNNDGVVDAADIAWVGSNGTFQVQNIDSPGVADLIGTKPKREFTGFQLVFNKRYSNRWQALASLLFSSSTGFGNRIYAQDMNFEGPMVTDNNFMGSLNQTVNNLTGTLPFTPKFELKISGSYTIPKLEADLGIRFRMHTGRPVWELQSYPEITQWSWPGPAGGVVETGGIGSIVGVSSPVYLPAQAIVDFRLEKSFRLARYGSLSVIFDAFNLFNANEPNSIEYQYPFGSVRGILTPRTFRWSFVYQF